MSSKPSLDARCLESVYRGVETVFRFLVTMAKLAPICWAGAKQAASERG